MAHRWLDASHLKLNQKDLHIMKTINTEQTIRNLFATMSHTDRQRLSLDIFRETIPNEVAVGATPTALKLRTRPIDILSRKESWKDRVSAYAQSRKGRHFSRQACAIALGETGRMTTVDSTLHKLKQAGIIAHTGYNQYTLAT